MKAIDNIFQRADERSERGMSTENQIFCIDVDILKTIDEAQQAKPNTTALDVAVKIIFDMFERYK